MSIHKEHRQRVKKRFLSEGLDHFEELHALEQLERKEAKKQGE